MIVRHQKFSDFNKPILECINFFKNKVSRGLRLILTRGDSYADRAEWSKATGGRDWCGCACCANRDRRNHRNKDSEVGQGSIRESGREGSRRETIARGADGNCQEGSRREVEVMATARAVANFFIKKSVQDKIPIDQLKLQKLVFYAYAWHIAHEKGELFPEDIFAWPHGPVVRELWYEFNSFGRNNIDKLASEIDWLCDPPVVYVPEITEKDEYLYKFLGNVWNVYKNASGIALSNLTHGPEEPWTIIREANKHIERPLIPPSLIEKKFKEKLAKAAQAN